MDSDKFSEKDVENAFIRFFNSQAAYKVTGQQVRLPVGIVDVVGREFDSNFVAEIKKGTIDERACTQLLGYMLQVHELIARRCMPTSEHILSGCGWPINGYLVGSSINKMSQRIISSSVFPIGFIQYKLEGGEINFCQINISRDWKFSPSPPIEDIIRRARDNYVKDSICHNIDKSGLEGGSVPVFEIAGGIKNMRVL